MPTTEIYYILRSDDLSCFSAIWISWITKHYKWFLLIFRHHLIFRRPDSLTTRQPSLIVRRPDSPTSHFFDDCDYFSVDGGIPRQNGMNAASYAYDVMCTVHFFRIYLHPPKKLLQLLLII